MRHILSYSAQGRTSPLIYTSETRPFGLTWLVLPIIIPLTLLLACSGKKDTHQTLSPAEVTWEELSYMAVDPGCAEPNPNDCAHALVEYLAFTSPDRPEVADSLNRFVTSHLVPSVDYTIAPGDPETRADRFVEQWARFKQEQDEYDIPWLDKTTAEVILQTERLISLRIKQMGYTGGAHGYNRRILASFDLTNGSRVEPVDIVGPKDVDSLTALAERDFRIVRRLQPDQGYEEAGFWFPGDTFSLPDNFMLNSKGFVFYYNPYEVTAYAAGPTRLMIRYDRVSAMIDFEGLPPNQK